MATTLGRRPPTYRDPIRKTSLAGEAYFKLARSFHYFFVDDQRGRILFIGGLTKSRSFTR